MCIDSPTQSHVFQIHGIADIIPPNRSNKFTIVRVVGNVHCFTRPSFTHLCRSKAPKIGRRRQRQQPCWRRIYGNKFKIWSVDVWLAKRGDYGFCKHSTSSDALLFVLTDWLTDCNAADETNHIDFDVNDVVSCDSSNWHNNNNKISPWFYTLPSIQHKDLNTSMCMRALVRACVCVCITMMRAFTPWTYSTTDRWQWEEAYVRYTFPDTYPAFEHVHLERIKCSDALHFAVTMIAVLWCSDALVRCLFVLFEWKRRSVLIMPSFV